MSEARRKYVRILRIELEDLQEDVQVLRQHCLDQKRHDGISNYVFRENMSLMRSEILAIESLTKVLDDLDPDAYADVDQLMGDLQRRFRESLEHHGMVKMLGSLLQRKFTKVARYVKEASGEVLPGSSASQQPAGGA